MASLTPLSLASRVTAQQTAPASELTRQIDQILNRPLVNQAHWGVYAVDLDSGETLYSLNPARKFIPASNMKILVTSSILWELGPDYRYRTQIHAVGEREGDVLRGDLVLVPSGDPTLSKRWGVGDDDGLRLLARQVAATGLRTISGDLIIAASRWDSTEVPESWMTGNLPWGYSAVPGPFAIAEGTTTIAVQAGSAGEFASITWGPPGTPDFVIGEVMTVAQSDEESRIVTTWLPESRVHHVTGTIRAGQTDTIEVSTKVPVREARARMIQILGEEGVALLAMPAPVTGWTETPPASSMSEGRAERIDPTTPLRPRDPILWAEADSLPPGCDPELIPYCELRHPIAWIDSPTLLEISRGALEPSQNWITEQLLKTLSLETTGVASWPNGTAALKEVLSRRAGVDTLDLYLQDGSGLSAYNLITPRAVVAILTAMDRSPLAVEYRFALASPGEDDSTLERRLEDVGARLQAKTGTLSNVNSLSGYVESTSGRRIVFSVLTNGSGLESSVMRASIDDVARALAGG